MYPAAMTIPESATLADLAKLPWVMPRRPNAIRALIDAVFGSSSSLTPKVVVEIDSLYSAMESVRRGVGVGPMTMSAMKDALEAGALRARQIGDTPLMRAMYLAHRRTPGLTPAAQFVYEILRDIAAEARLA